jgi:hypothetical protein
MARPAPQQLLPNCAAGWSGRNAMCRTQRVCAALPGGGLQRDQLHEVIEGGPAGELAAIATLFTSGIAARIPGSVL